MKISINISISKLHIIHVDLTSTLHKIFLLVGKEFSPWACGDTNRQQCKYLWEFQNIFSVPGNFPVKRWQLLPKSIWQIIAFVVFSLPAYTYTSESVSWISLAHNLTSAISRRSSSKSIPSYFHVAVALSPDTMYGQQGDCKKQLYFIRPLPS